MSDVVRCAIRWCRVTRCRYADGMFCLQDTVELVPVLEDGRFVGMVCSGFKQDDDGDTETE